MLLILVILIMPGLRVRYKISTAIISIITTSSIHVNNNNNNHGTMYYYVHY